MQSKLNKTLLLSLFIIILSGLFLGCSSNVKDPEILGEFKGHFVGIRLSEENGQKYLIARYEFTNNSNNESTFLEALDPNAYQNGLPLERIDSDSLNMPIPINETYNIDVQYILNYQKSNVDLEITNNKTNETYKKTIDPTL